MPIVYIDRSDVREGRAEDLKAAMRDLSDFVESHIPQLLGYGFYLNESATEMTVVAIHPDSASLEYHLETGASAFRRMGEFLVLRTIEVYGRPSDKALRQLQQKADALGEEDSRVAILDHYAGFSRISPVLT